MQAIRKSVSRQMANDKRQMLNAKWLFLLLLVFLPTSVSAQEIVDKTVATVNSGVRTDLITYSDLLWQLALQPNTPISQPTSETLNAALRLVEDQRLILQEAVKLPTIAPTEQEITVARDSLVKQFPSQEEFRQRMIRVGLTSEKLNEILEQRVHIEKLSSRKKTLRIITKMSMCPVSGVARRL